MNPEVHAVLVDGRWTARVDERSLPEIRISKRYVDMLSNPDVDEETREYIKGKIASARLFVEAVERRQETIVSIAQAIFDAQPGFFEAGLRGLKPLTMQEVADKVGVHHTTVSRTVRDKYASTPRGTVELRRFFVTGYVTEGGGAVSRDGVVEALKGIIDSEDPANPLSDEALSARLKAAGYPVARRTVAKYRAELGVAGAAARRRLPS